MAHYSSDSQLWYDESFLALGRLERQLVLYMMHGPGRSNVPGIIEDSPVNIADRLREDVEEIRAALKAMTKDPHVLRWDPQKRLLSSPLAARMDPYRGSKNIRGWHKNWAHLPDGELKYTHIETLKEKVDLANEEQVRIWNETFGAERPAHAVAGREPAQLRLIHDASKSAPTRGGAKHQPRNQETVKGLPNREDVVHVTADEYVERYAGDLITHGQVHALGADLDIFEEAMADMIRKAPGHKRACEWDTTAANYIETALLIRRMRNKQGGPTTTKKTRGHNEDNRGGGTGTRRASKPRNRGAAANDQAGQWSARLSEKAAEPPVFSDS